MVARQELRQYTAYDYVITNDQLDMATKALQAIIIAERQRIGRVMPTLFDGTSAFPMHVFFSVGFPDDQRLSVWRDAGSRKHDITK